MFLQKLFPKQKNLIYQIRFLNAKPSEPKSSYDAVVIGGGHNGLVAAAYLQKAGLKACVLEKRHIIGGAAVTEEIIPEFKFSRASYVLSLFRPIIFKELKLKEYGVKVFLRNPNSFTPLSEWKPNQPKSLSLYLNSEDKLKEIGRFSRNDFQAYIDYDKSLTNVINSITPLLDYPPPDISALINGNWMQKLKALSTLKPLKHISRNIKQDFPFLMELLFSSAYKILNERFETDCLKATLATDGVIGALQSPMSPGSGYLLLHHVMGGVEGIDGAWGYVQGGMGAVSQAIAAAATDLGVDIFTEKKVRNVKVCNNQTKGVVLDNGMEINARLVLSNATPKITFLDLLDDGLLPADYKREISRIDYVSAVTKINIALKGLPNFTVAPHSTSPLPHHQASIHINCEDLNMLENAYIDAKQGKLPQRPMIEMMIPSTLDDTLAPKGSHVCLIFSQFTPYHLSDGKKWDSEMKKKYFDIVIDSIDRYAPSFRNLIIGYEVLTPPDLEDIFSLTGGNIFHGALSLDQLYINRPTSLVQSPNTPIKGLFLCGSGSHPGGGVTGAPGRLAAITAIKSCRKKLF